MREINIKIELPDSTSQKDTRTAFWEPIVNIYQQFEKEGQIQRNPIIDASFFENQIRQNFSNEILNGLKTRFSTQAYTRKYSDKSKADSEILEALRNSSSDSHRFSRRADRLLQLIEKIDEREIAKKESLNQDYIYLRLREKEREIHFITIKTRILGYSSLNLGIEIEPLEKLIHLFDNNFEYFRVFLEGYIPEAFTSSINESYVNGFDEVSTLNFSYEIDIPDEVKNSFNEADIRRTNAIAKQNNQYKTKNDRAIWLMGLLKSPLLLPFLLALLVLYLAFNKLESYHNIRDSQFTPIFEKYNKLIQHYEKHMELESDGSEEKNK